MSRSRFSIAIVLAVLLASAFSNWNLQADEIRFERIQLSNEFYSEGGTYGDFNGDGKGDVAVGPWIYWGDNFEKRSKFYEGDKFDPINYSKNFLMYTDDVDRDGVDDILVIGFPGAESWWYRSPGKDAADKIWEQHTMLDVVDNESPMIVDVNGDKIKDLLCQSGGHIGFASHAGRNAKEKWEFRKCSPDNKYQRFTHGIGTGDVNNDGRSDLLEKGGWWENPGNDVPADQLWKFHAVEFSAGGGSQMYAVDFNGDGKNEVLTSLAAHGFGLAYYKALDTEATKFERVDIMTGSASTSPVGLAVSQLHAVDIGDINGDGLPDIVTGKRWWAHGPGDDGSSQPAILVWFESQRAGDRVMFIPHVVDVSSGVGTQIMLGDVNGDGLQDIVSGTKRGAYLFLQRPKNKPASEAMVPGLASSDKFHQRPANQSLSIKDKTGGFRPALDGRPLNFDFETEQLIDWEVRGSISNELVRAVDAGHIATSKATNDGEKAIGELISRPFQLDHDWASLLVGGSKHDMARVELISNETGSVLATFKGEGDDAMKRVTLDCTPWKGHQVRLRLVDHANDAHVSLDDFRLHDEKP